MRFRDILNEPLAQFLVIGLSLFLLHGWIAPGDGEGRRIVVSQARVDDMAREYRAQLGQAPTEQQLQGLVDTYVRDEIVYREGMAQGLGSDDPVIRRRVVQKYQIMLEEGVGQDTPTDAELAAYLHAHASDFARPGRVTFEQVFFDISGQPERVKANFEAAERATARGEDPSAHGQQTLLPRRVEAAPLDLVAGDFGQAFADGLTKSPIGAWSGPVPSSYGVHLVRVTARAAPSLPPLAEVRPLVAREWEADRRRRAVASNFQRMRRDYDVAVEANLTPKLASR